MSDLPVPTPRVNLETKPFWDATAEHRLVLPHCNACGFVIWYPRARCPECHSTDVRWEDASGQGVVYSFSVTRKGGGDYRAVGPYVLAYVELDEGPRVLTNIVGADPASLEIGQRVRVVFDDSAAGTALYRFTPV